MCTRPGTPGAARSAPTASATAARTPSEDGLRRPRYLPGPAPPQQMGPGRPVFPVSRGRLRLSVLSVSAHPPRGPSTALGPLTSKLVMVAVCVSFARGPDRFLGSLQPPSRSPLGPLRVWFPGVRRCSRSWGSLAPSSSRLCRPPRARLLLALPPPGPCAGPSGSRSGPGPSPRCGGRLPSREGMVKQSSRSAELPLGKQLCSELSLLRGCLMERGGVSQGHTQLTRPVSRTVTPEQ